jgi:hypothetical protein
VNVCNAGEREIVWKKEGEEKGSASGSVQWGCYYATALDIEVDLQRRCVGCRESDFALQRLVECRALETERVLWIGFISINDMYNNDVGKGGVYAYEAYEVK